MSAPVRVAALACVLVACPPVPGAGDTESTGGPATTTTTAGPTTVEPVTTTTTTTEPTASSTTVTSVGPTTEPPVPVCGDGIVSGDEECDDGNTEDGDCCTSTCTKGQAEPGQVCWTAIVEGSKNGEDLAGGIAVDAAGDIYIDATVIDTLQGPDALIRKFDPGGVSQWTQQY
ncbi:MAG TPA: DUF4215 domain-containing protein, partial [Nannocystis sp.]